MEYQLGQDRHQLTLYSTCLEDMIAPENPVRFIDLFVDGLDLQALGFNTLSSQGRPPYNPADLLKLYIYGYMNRTRSSRQLEKECHRNLELIWLLKTLKPDHNTISRFRKDNPDAIKRVFRQSVQLAKNFNLIGGVLIAGDSTKLRAQNSKKNNYNEKKVARHLDYIEAKLAEYNQALAQADGDIPTHISEQISRHKTQRVKYQRIHKQLRDLSKKGIKQVSTSDPDSRHQIVRGAITEVSYTMQTTVDADHKLLIDYKVTAENDKKAMGPMLRRAKSILGTTDFTALYDKGYHSGSQLAIADELGIQTLVAVPDFAAASHAPNPEYNVSEFIYDKESDCYICPQGHSLTTNQTLHDRGTYAVKQYRTKECKGCPVRDECTRSKANGRIIQRSEYAHHIEANSRRVAEHESVYKKRQALVEHPFGTIKRQWGFDHIMTKRGIQRASADVGLIALAYNLRRLLTILGTHVWELLSSVLAYFWVWRGMCGLIIQKMTPMFKKWDDRLKLHLSHYSRSSIPIFW